MSDRVEFNNVDDFLELCNKRRSAVPDDNTKELGLSFALPKRTTPDMTLVDKAVLIKAVLAVGIILGVPISDEKAAAIALIISVIGGFLLHSDARRRVARNDRARHENESMINAMVHLSVPEEEE